MAWKGLSTGGGGYINFGDTTLLDGSGTTLFMSFWAKIPTWVDFYQNMLNKDNYPANGWIICRYDFQDYILFSTRGINPADGTSNGETRTYSSVTNFSALGWVCVSAYADVPNKRQAIYVNGTKDFSTYCGNPMANNAQNLNAMFRNDNHSQAEVAFWVGLTEDEADQYHNSMFNGKVTPLHMPKIPLIYVPMRAADGETSEKSVTTTLTGTPASIQPADDHPPLAFTKAHQRSYNIIVTHKIDNPAVKKSRNLYIPVFAQKW